MELINGVGQGLVFILSIPISVINFLINIIISFFKWFYNIDNIKLLLQINYGIGALLIAYEFFSKEYNIYYRLVIVTILFGLYGYLLYYYD